MTETSLLVAYIFVNILLVTFVTLISYIISPRNYQPGQLREYECGFTKQTFLEGKQNIFYLRIAIVYILFEWEIAVLYPVSSADSSENPIAPTVLLFTALIAATSLLEEVGTIFSFENWEGTYMCVYPEYW